MNKSPSPALLIPLLGMLSVISPFAIDMYLSVFAEMADDLAVPSSAVALTLSSYFLGLAVGQIMYGPLLDRFGRKKPLCAGLALFVASSIACAFSPNFEVFVIFRFLQALGGGAAGVASLALVRDFFPREQAPRIISRLFLFIAISPLLAPSVGGMVAMLAGWKAVFIILAVVVGGMLFAVYTWLPEGHQPDKGISLKPLPILREYKAIFLHPRFMAYALTGAFSFAGLFTYVAGSPLVFMQGFGLSAKEYSGVFAFLAVGFIGGSQLNVALLKRYSSERLFACCLGAQLAVAVALAGAAVTGMLSLPLALGLFFFYLACTGITYPNAAALAIAPFSRNAGSASALLGFLQLGIGGTISSAISLFVKESGTPVMVILAATSCAACLVLLATYRRALRAPMDENVQ